MCNNEHAPGLLDPKIDDEEHEPKHLFMINHKYFRNLSTDITIAAGEAKKTKTFEEIMPEAYHEYNNVFAKEMFNELPPHGPWDHAIELLPGNHKVDCKTYNLTIAKQKELDDFLEENLSTGHIQPSKSQFTSAFYFVKITSHPKLPEIKQHHSQKPVSPIIYLWANRQTKKCKILHQA